ncbi:MAG: GIY-YIG nuclease family protein, partial [Oscillospiraceae bacterium]|nr:GIY-YIG nuclease family protein [Oscillospiraceae bacterium]
MNIEKLREKAARLPLKPGVYIMSDEKGEIIYVGKAKKLKNRVSSYFHGAHNLKTETMVSRVADFNVIIAASEFEALVLENQLIKHHMPRYNILLKDDKGYPFIRLDRKSDYPRFSISAERHDDGAAYFGPYGGRGVSKMLITEISKALLLPTCSRVFPRDIGKARPCLEYHIGGCAGYCLEGASHEEYLEAVERAVMILQGKTGGLIGSLREEMEQAADALMFERAAVL